MSREFEVESKKDGVTHRKQFIHSDSKTIEIDESPSIIQVDEAALFAAVVDAIVGYMQRFNVDKLEVKRL